VIDTNVLSGAMLSRDGVNRKLLRASLQGKALQSDVYRALLLAIPQSFQGYALQPQKSFDPAAHTQIQFK